MRVKIKKCAPKMEQGGKLVPVEVEKQETASLPNGKEVEFNGPSHENGGVETLLPINSKVKSDFLKPSSLLKKKEELEELSEMLGVKVSKKDTYASIEIHIKPENKGKFNATKARTGKTTEELTHSSNPITRKRAIFALNASHWKHEKGGYVEGKEYDLSPEQIKELQKQGYELEILK